MGMKKIEFEDIKVGDKIITFYHSGFSCGVATKHERMYDDPERDETVWEFDGMEYIGSSIGSWMVGGDNFLVEDGDLPHSPNDQFARNARERAEEDA